MGEASFDSVTSGGASFLHLSVAFGQRGWKAQPVGNAKGFGGLPGIEVSRLRRPSRGTEASSPCV